MKLHVLENDAICRLLIYVEEITAAIQTIVLERINRIAKMIADRSIYRLEQIAKVYIISQRECRRRGNYLRS